MYSFDITVDLEIYDLDAIKFAAYTFVENGYVKIEKNDDFKAVVKIETNNEPELVKKAFFNELLHQSLRVKVAKHNSKIRERIVLQALVSAVHPDMEKEKGNPAVSKEIADMALEDEINKLLKEAEEGSYKDDPLNIAIPWEEKNK